MTTPQPIPDLIMNCLLVACLLTAPPLPAQDAPGHLGDGSGVFPGADIRTDWNRVPPQLLWHRRIGAGTTGFAIVGKRAIVGGNDGGRDVWWCIDSDYGTPLWQYVYDEPPAPDRHAAGPAATACIDHDRVYLLSRSGSLHCVNLEQGELLWQRRLAGTDDQPGPAGGYTASPVAFADGVLVPGGRGAAALTLMGRADGEIRWRSPDLGAAILTAPRLLDVRGTRLAWLMLPERTVGLAPGATPAVIHQINWPADPDPRAWPPQWVDGRLFLPAGRGSGAATFELAGAGSLTPVRLPGESTLRFRSAVVCDGEVVGLAATTDDRGCLARVDPVTLQTRWTIPLAAASGSCVLAGPHLIVLCDDGAMLVGTPATASFETHGRIRVLKGPCHAPLGFAHQRFFARNNDGTALCMDLSPPKPVPPGQPPQSGASVTPAAAPAGTK